MKTNPVKLVGYLDKLLWGILFLNLILTYLEEFFFRDKDYFGIISPMIMPLLYLVIAIPFIYQAFKLIQKHIETLEDKLDGQAYRRFNRKERKMKMTSIKLIGFTWIIFFVALLHNLFDLYKSREEGHFDMVLPMVLPLLYLVIAIPFIYFAFKYLQKRIDALEEKLKEKNQTEK